MARGCPDFALSGFAGGLYDSRMPADSDFSRCTAIVVAAGSSRRMGFDKLAANLSGIPVLRRTVEAFLAAETIAEVVVVCPADRWPLVAGDSMKPLTRVEGGADRQHSVAAGLASARFPYVAVHDGARPLITPAEIDRCVKQAMLHRAVSLARRVTETLKRSTPENFSKDAVSRENLWFMETPQAFETILLREAYAVVAARGITVTDEVSAMEVLGMPVKFVESTGPNLKITTPADLALAEALLK